MKFKNKNWWKHAGIRAAKTTVQTLLASSAITTLAKEDIRIALITSLGAGVLSLINSMLVELPEVDIDPDMSITPDIEDEELIDTSNDDAKLNGGGINE